MKNKILLFSILYFFALCTYGQYRIDGKVVSTTANKPVPDCLVILNNKLSVLTDESGNFEFTDLLSGNYELIASSTGFGKSTTRIAITSKNETVLLAIKPKNTTLKEVVITEKNAGLGYARMRAVDNMGIYEGKKTEVILPEQLVANLATNNARQIYARVAGLNIWENEGAGIQLSVGGRGLDPNRTSNFNVRQNGYDISADALGYPESYYTPPVEAVAKIQLVRGAASLQYGTQFGGLLNFVLKAPTPDKKVAVVARQSIGSFGFYNGFTSLSGTSGKISYYTFAQYKQGNGWRPNAAFTNYTLYANANYQITEKTALKFDITHMEYLAQQPGGLSDALFVENARQSNRERNWFAVNWNLAALHFDYKPNINNQFNLRVFGLLANRYSVGFRPNRVATIDDNSERDLIKGDFRNFGVEGRYLKRYTVLKKQNIALVGMRYYNGFNHSQQGLGSKGKDANFMFAEPNKFINYDYRFPNKNVALFLENIVYLSEKISVTPGIRTEYITTKANGFYSVITNPDLTGSGKDTLRTSENRDSKRSFLLGGIGISYKPNTLLDLYGNISQNYRSITFSDMRITNPSSVIDPNLTDEKGYSFDVGIRSNNTLLLNYDVSLFFLNYANRIGEVQIVDENDRILRQRTNVGKATVQGIESYAELDIVHLLFRKQENYTGAIFVNTAFIQSEYKNTTNSGINGNKVEFVPAINTKTGIRLGYKKLQTSLQYTYLSEQFSDATNAINGGVSSVVGIIPAYAVIDASIAYTYKWAKLEGSINNLANAYYFTRRATGYPGPGILPSDGRSFYLTLQVKI